MADTTEALRALVAHLPKCSFAVVDDDEHGRKHCGAYAFWRCRDWTDEPWHACDEHREPGGTFGDVEPVPLPWAQALRAAVEQLRAAAA